jgi:hypothetical protein
MIEKEKLSTALILEGITLLLLNVVRMPIMTTPFQG